MCAQKVHSKFASQNMVISWESMTFGCATVWILASTATGWTILNHQWSTSNTTTQRRTYPGSASLKISHTDSRLDSAQTRDYNWTLAQTRDSTMITWYDNHVVPTMATESTLLSWLTEVPPLSGLAALETLNLSHNKIQDLENGCEVIHVLWGWQLQRINRVRRQYLAVWLVLTIHIDLSTSQDVGTFGVSIVATEQPTNFSLCKPAKWFQ